MEWDALAPRRHAQLLARKDLSFEHVLAPLTNELLHACDTRVLLDIGCGTGALTSRVARIADRVIGLDLSTKNLALAKDVVSSGNVDFVHGALEDLVSTLSSLHISSALAAMTLMTVPDLRAFVEALRSVLPDGGRFVATMTHPWFWPKYWRYDEAHWFSYAEEIFIEAPFNISTDHTGILTTHVHRPLESYLSMFEAAGFVLEALREPMPNQKSLLDVQGPWNFPRFIGLRWMKAG